MKLTEELVLAKAHSESLATVRCINTWGEHLSDVSIVSHMPNLEIAIFSVNSITDIQDFRSCFKLRELYLRRNSIADLSQIRHLRGLNELRVLWLSENPCAHGDNYRLKVIRNLPNVELLDNVRVTEDERLAAAACNVFDAESASSSSFDELAISACTEHQAVPFNSSAPTANASGEVLIQAGDDDEQVIETERPEPSRLSFEEVTAEQPSEADNHTEKLKNIENGHRLEEQTVSNDEEEVDVGQYWQAVASVADQLLTRQESQGDDKTTVEQQSEAPANRVRRRRTRRPESERAGDAQPVASRQRPVTRKGVHSRRDTKLIDAITSLLEIVDDRVALEHIRNVVDSRLGTINQQASHHSATANDGPTDGENVNEHETLVMEQQQLEEDERENDENEVEPESEGPLFV